MSENNYNNNLRQSMRAAGGFCICRLQAFILNSASIVFLHRSNIYLDKKILIIYIY